MNEYGFKVSLPGYDVKTATPEQCSVHSSYPPFKSKINQSPPHLATLNVDFTSTITQNLTQVVYQIPHGYSYIPLTIANIVFNDGNPPSPTAIGIGFAGIGATLAIDAYCDASNFYISVYDNFSWTSANATLQVSYYIFAENGT